MLKILADKIDDFYLGGGTALSLFYFQHRLSIDLDFFTPSFSRKRIDEIIKYLEDALRKKTELIEQGLEKDKARLRIYNIYFTKKDILKIDFVEDFFKLIKRLKVVDGIKILSLEDIYIRKLYALVGRVEAKDFFDIYFLSRTFMPLSKFANKHTDNTIKEGLVNWFRTYDRMAMMNDFLNLNIDQKMDYKKMEKYFDKEISKIIQSYIEKI